MDKEFEQIIKALKNIKLKEEEKIFMREDMLTKIDSILTQSVTNKESNRLNYYYQQYIKNYFSMLNKNKFAYAFVIAVVVVLGGSSAFAEKAVPGDLLYGVKVSVNEKAAGVFAFSKEDKAKWKERLVERRLKEARKLVSKDNLDESTRIGLENKIQSQIDDFNESLNELAKGEDRSLDSSDLNIRLQASLRAHQDVFEKFAKKNRVADDMALSNKDREGEDKLKNEVKKLASSIKESKKGARLDHEKIVKGGQEEGALNLLNAIKLLYQKEKVNLSKNIQDQVEKKLALAEGVFEEAKKALDSRDDENSKDKFKLVTTMANEAKLLMLSNVIKTDIEDDMGIDDDDDDIEEHEFDDDDDDEDDDEDDRFEDDDEDDEDDEIKGEDHSKESNSGRSDLDEFENEIDD